MSNRARHRLDKRALAMQLARDDGPIEMKDGTEVDLHARWKFPSVHPTESFGKSPEAAGEDLSQRAASEEPLKE